LTDGQLCTLLGLIAVGLEERASSFSGEDLRTLVHLHQRFVRMLGLTESGYDYLCRDGVVVEARNPRKVVARYRRRAQSRLTLRCPMVDPVELSDVAARVVWLCLWALSCAIAGKGGSLVPVSTGQPGIGRFLPHPPGQP